MQREDGASLEWLCRDALLHLLARTVVHDLAVAHGHTITELRTGSDIRCWQSLQLCRQALRNILVEDLGSHLAAMQQEVALDSCPMEQFATDSEQLEKKLDVLARESTATTRTSTGATRESTTESVANVPLGTLVRIVNDGLFYGQRGRVSGDWVSLAEPELAWLRISLPALGGSTKPEPVWLRPWDLEAVQPPKATIQDAQDMAFPELAPMPTGLAVLRDPVPDVQGQNVERHCWPSCRNYGDGPCDRRQCAL